MFRQGRWAEVHQAAAAATERTAEVEFWHGLALARLERWPEAEQRLRAGRSLAPRDARFPTELAGVEFKRKRYAEAAAWLRRAARLAPDDPYLHNFLGTVYLLLGNVEAALKQWNGTGGPRAAAVIVPDDLRTDPLLLDRAFDFAAGDVLAVSRWRTTIARIESFDIFRQPSYRLEARPDGDFDFRFAARERNGWGSNRLEVLMPLLRGLPYLAVHPEYSNAGGRGLNIDTMLRWDPDKQRARVLVSAPFGRLARYRWRGAVDVREERWQLRRLQEGFGSLRLSRRSIETGVSSVGAGWQWSTGGEVSHRSYADVQGAAPQEPGLGSAGVQLKHMARFTRDLLRAPERRLEAWSSLSSEAGRIWSNPSRLFERLQASATLRWNPQAAGDDWAVEVLAGAGRIFGHAPFDELFLLGLERDNDLRLRAHPGTRDGRKGSAPLSRRYALFNSEIDKDVLRRGLVRLQISPFFDAGRAGGGSVTAPRRWLFDTGMQAKVRLPGAGFTFTYGKDLRSGNDIVYVTASR